MDRWEVPIRIWMDAWFKHLSMIDKATNVSWPVVSLLIARSHDWCLLLASKSDEEVTIWEKLDIGSTRSCFDMMEVVAVLHQVTSLWLGLKRHSDRGSYP